MHYRTLIISDLHLGAPDAKYKQLENFLSQHTYDNLILNGDLIDGMYLKFFDARKKEYTEFLRKIIELTQHHCKITYIMGNHDLNRHKNIKINRDAIEIKMNMIYKSGTKNYFICHGQQLDEKGLKGLENIAFLGGVFIHRLNRIYNKQRQKKGLEYKSIIGKIKDIGKYIMVGNSNIVHNKITKMCIANKTDGFICGHIHHSANMFINGFHYLNSGDWVESMTALAETSEHQWNILYYR